MMSTTSISDVNWCCCKWFENRSRFGSSESICRPGLGTPQAPLLAPAVRIANPHTDFQLERSPDYTSAPQNPGRHFSQESLKQRWTTE
jgi:hypothetical protein